MRVLLLVHSFNSLSQRLYTECRARGHVLSVEFDINDSVTKSAVELFKPDIILAPFLKRRIPESVWRRHTCLVVHPGIPGDRGPAALDWAIMNRETAWGVTVLQAKGEMDAGPVWAWCDFPMRAATKSSLYRREVTTAAVRAVMQALERFQSKSFEPLEQNSGSSLFRGIPHPCMQQAERRIDWLHDDTDSIITKIRAADGQPGVRDTLLDLPCRLYDVHPEGVLRGNKAGEVIAKRNGAVCCATRDGAVWIGHLKSENASDPAFKLPAAQVLAGQLDQLPAVHVPIDAVAIQPTWRDIRYEEDGAIGYLHFDFYNGAMSTAQCIRLRRAYRWARRRPTRVIVLMGGEDFWSNGLNLNVIEAAASPADESWRNIIAMDNLARDIILTDDHCTVAALQGNAGAGGVFLALAADHVLARDGIVLNPHYKNMGNLYGSEYWTYLLPKRVPGEAARNLLDDRLPIAAQTAQGLGLVDMLMSEQHSEFRYEVKLFAHQLATQRNFRKKLVAKTRLRTRDESVRPLETYRNDELDHMKLNFYGFDPSYHVARYRFVHHTPHAWTPLYLATHRRAAGRAPAAGKRPAALPA